MSEGEPWGRARQEQGPCASQWGAVRWELPLPAREMNETLPRALTETFCGRVT